MARTEIQYSLENTDFPDSIFVSDSGSHSQASGLSKACCINVLDMILYATGHCIRHKSAATFQQ